MNEPKSFSSFAQVISPISNVTKSRILWQNHSCGKCVTFFAQWSR
jgi:hypothetical protein